MQEKYNNLYEKLVALKQKVDNNEISMDSLSNVEIAALSLMYEIEMMNLDEKLAIRLTPPIIIIKTLNNSTTYSCRNI